MYQSLCWSIVQHNLTILPFLQYKPKASMIRFQIKSGPRHSLAKLRNIVKGGYRKDCRTAVLKKASAIIRSEKTRVSKKAKPAKKAE